MNARILFGAALAAVMVLAGAGGVLLARMTSASGPAATVQSPQSPFEGSLMPKGIRAPDFTLRDQNGRHVSMSEYRGRPVIVAFLRSKCKLSCPVDAQIIRGALDDVGKGVPALAISVEPSRDTPASARAFNRKQNVGGRLRWVLGRRPELRPLWRGFAIQPQLRNREHQWRITLVDKRGFQRVGWPGGRATSELLAHDLRVLLRE